MAAVLEEGGAAPLRWYVSKNETAGHRVGGALAAVAARYPGARALEQVSEAGEADLIWLNTPSRACREACAGCGHYNHVAGARQALEDKCRLGELQRRMGERTLWSEAFRSARAAARWVAAHVGSLEGPWVVKDATANSGVGLWFAASPRDLLDLLASGAVDARGEVVLQRYLQRPMLWRGRKLQFRVYAVWRGRDCFLYRGAMAQVCARPYAPPAPGAALDGATHVTAVAET